MGSPARWTISIGVGFALMIGSSANGQDAQFSYRTSGAKSANRSIPCDRLPTAAVKTVPPPFDRYMMFECNDRTGQGLRPVDGFHWRNQDGVSIGLTSTSEAGGPDGKGEMHFPFSWYAKLEPIALTPKEQEALRLLFGKAIRPSFLAGATVLEMKAITSNTEEKRIYLVVPDTKPGLPKWLVGLECDGACFTDDPQPMLFAGEPNG